MESFPGSLGSEHITFCLLGLGFSDDVEAIDNDTADPNPKGRGDCVCNREDDDNGDDGLQ